MTTTRSHPAEDALVAYSLGQLGDAESEAVEEHLAGCPACQARVAAVAPDTLVGLLVTVAPQLDATLYPTVPAGELPTPPFQPTLAWEPNCAPHAVAVADPPPVPAELANHKKYRVLKWLGDGGMGSVWLVEHLVMRNRVAVKVIRPELLAQPGASERFLREIRAVSRLEHPNIVRALDAEANGRLCLFAMEYVQGRTLAQVVRAHGPLAPAEACAAVRDAARGLAHAHALGMVHRDVKPHNLMRANDGTVKVLDFGLALVASGTRSGARRGEAAMCGTPDYMAPEQFGAAGTADDRADVYGLGCTLYHLLAGRPPFAGGNLADKCAAHTGREPDPIPGLPDGLAVVLARMMAKRPEDRFQSAEEVIAALAPFCPDALPAEPAPPVRPRRRGPAVALALLACALLFATGAAVYRFQTDTGDLVIETTDDEIEVLVKQGGQVVTVFDPRTKQKVTLRSGEYEFEIDGRPAGLKLNIESTTLKRGDIVVAKITRTAPRPPTGGEVAKKPDAPTPNVPKLPAPTDRAELGLPGHTNALLTAPDGKRVLVGTGDGTVAVWTPGDTRAVRTFADAHRAGITRLAWSANGTRAATADAAGNVWLWDAVAGTRTRAFAGASGCVGVGFLPNGRVWIVRQNAADVFDPNTGTSELRFAPPAGELFHCAAATPDGKRFLTGSHFVLRQWDAGSGKELAPLGRHPHWIGTVAVSADGTRAACGCNGGAVSVWNLATEQLLARRPAVRGHAAAMCFSPDGTRLALTGGVTDPALRVLDADTATELAAVTRTANTLLPAFAPDGTKVYTGQPNGRVFIDPAPPVPRRELRSTGRWDGHTGIVSDLALTADGKRAVSVDGHGLVIVHDGAKVLKSFKTDAEAFTALALSPDEKVVALGCAKNALKWYDLDTGKELGGVTNPTGRVRGIAFTADGKHLFAAGYSGAALWDRATGKAVREFDCTGLTCHWGALSPDGTRVLVAGGRANGTTHGGAGELRVFDTKTGKRVQTLTGSDAVVAHAAFAPDGSRVVAACLDGTARVWALDTGKQEHVFRHPAGCWVQRAALTSDGRQLVTTFNFAARATTDGFAVWDLRTERAAYSSEPSNGGYSLALTPNGLTALVGDNAGGSVRAYLLPAPSQAGALQVSDFRTASGLDAAELKKWAAELPRSFRPADVTARTGAKVPRFDAVAVRDGSTAPFVLSTELGTAARPYSSDFSSMIEQGFSLRAVATYPVGGDQLRHQLWVKDGREWYGNGYLERDLPAAATDWRKRGLRPTGFHETRAPMGGQPLVGVVLGPADGWEWEFHTALTQPELLAFWLRAKDRGWRIDALSGFGTGAARRYAVTLVNDPFAPAWDLKTDLTAAKFEEEVAAQRKRGLRPLAVASHGDGAAVRYDAVWVEFSPAR